MSGSRFPWLPALALTLATVWAAAGSGASSSRGADRGWGGPALLAQLPPGYSDEDGSDAGDTLGIQEDEPLTNPDTTQSAPPPAAPPDTAGAATPPAVAPTDTTSSPTPTGPVAPVDTTGVTVPDTLRANVLPAAPDSATAAARKAAAADSGIADTLYMNRPRPQAQPPKAATPPQEKKPRSGIFGIHPIAILLGLAALHYFVTRSTGD